MTEKAQLHPALEHHRVRESLQKMMKGMTMKVKESDLTLVKKNKAQQKEIEHNKQLSLSQDHHRYIARERITTQCTWPQYNKNNKQVECVQNNKKL